jgi:hypothetical protein
MNCHEFEQRLNDVLDRRGQPEADERLGAHAADCSDCRTRLIGARVLLRGLSRLAVPALPRQFARRVVAEVGQAVQPASAEKNVRPTGGRWWLAGGVLLASAACALLAVSIIWYARRGGDTNNVATRDPAPPAEKRADLPRAKQLRRSNTYAMTGGDILIEAPRLPERLREYRGAIDNLAIALPRTAEQFDQMEQLAPGLRPFRLSLALLWDTLCRTIPGARTGEPAVPHEQTSDWRWTRSLFA